ncbi:hypothetical protein BJX68DRAFT_262998 [Aspergillus pseudodeflectus]|uniref:Uncharacterized protein n=1 Tax=Aspergillus pseudodeflectus TaxID=176178 RepID=A0ABR4KZA5_9EURO
MLEEEEEEEEEEQQLEDGSSMPYILGIVGDSRSNDPDPGDFPFGRANCNEIGRILPWLVLVEIPAAKLSRRNGKLGLMRGRMTVRISETAMTGNGAPSRITKGHPSRRINGPAEWIYNARTTALSGAQAGTSGLQIQGTICAVYGVRPGSVDLFVERRRGALRLDLSMLAGQSTLRALRLLQTE